MRLFMILDWRRCKVVHTNTRAEQCVHKFDTFLLDVGLLLIDCVGVVPISFDGPDLASSNTASSSTKIVFKSLSMTSVTLGGGVVGESGDVTAFGSCNISCFCWPVFVRVFRICGLQVVPNSVKFDFFKNSFKLAMLPPRIRFPNLQMRPSNSEF
jgi:hypothetical protein